MVFVEGGKPEKKPQSKAKTNNKLNPHMTPGRNPIRATLVGGEHSDHCATDCSLLSVRITSDVSRLCLFGPSTVLYLKGRNVFVRQQLMFALSLMLMSVVKPDTKVLKRTFYLKRVK